MTDGRTTQGPATLVLVHGAWADGSSWGPVIAPLQRQGLAVRAAPLPLTSLADDVAALDRVLERIDGPVVLAGHAYAGAVIAAARPDRIRSLVFVAALAPDEGETVMDVFQRAAPHPLAPRLAPDAHGALWLPDEAFPTAFAQHAPAESAAVLAAVQRPIHLPCITTPVGRPLWRDRPSWYLLAEEDRMIAAATQRFMAARMGAALRPAPVDHAPLVSAPELAVEILLEAVRASG
ncbi:alpha/beta fold hydrolase [Inquilinus limosus]|uniref:alpha/beta fold hydrolase n=1 Tax=Inquilinus limosus TaxID=171674 RepID=UPI00068B3A1D|nr:alpha/beta hydrolase [Inquilinus limosus]